ncbi:MAG: cardiolipin synthase [Duncaniella sp.]|nr:cardiolipin synthase [Duncaniella sp.]MDE6117890.1 cardiolipin synthase [Duncaniella sp.]MDE7146353.1 cardiolipin synthase [Duncaniella sp.]
MLTLFISITLKGLLWGLLVAYGVLIICVIGIVLSENRNPLKSLAWVTGLLLFPVGGVILYFLFGRSIKNVKMISRRNRRKLLKQEDAQPLPRINREISIENRQIIRLGYSIAGAIFYTGNDLRVFNDGKSHFEHLFDDLRRATTYINLQFYIIANDVLGRELRDILIDRARHGVKVRVIYDYIGSFDARRRDFFKKLRENGVEVHSFFRLAFPNHINRVNWRNHRKVVVIDGKTGYIGGMNVAERYITGKPFGKWRDTAVRITGPAVAGLQYNFAVDWKFMGHALLCDDVNSAPSPIPGSIGNVMVQLITSGPTNRWGNMLLIFLKAISTAKRRVFLQTPYFLPSDGLLKALESAALSGVDVRVMLPRRSDSWILTYASRSYVEECLLAGIKIYLYEAGMLHGKVLVVDDDFASTGSTNFDFRSFEHNFEENVVTYSEEVNTELAGQFMEDTKECTRLKLAEWNRRPKSDKAKESIFRLLSPIL